MCVVKDNAVLGYYLDCAAAALAVHLELAFGKWEKNQIPSLKRGPMRASCHLTRSSDQACSCLSLKYGKVFSLNSVIKSDKLVYLINQDKTAGPAVLVIFCLVAVIRNLTVISSEMARLSEGCVSAAVVQTLHFFWSLLETSGAGSSLINASPAPI